MNVQTVLDGEIILFSKPSTRDRHDIFEGPNTTEGTLLPNQTRIARFFKTFS